jgi:hypothetical protein
MNEPPSHQGSAANPPSTTSDDSSPSTPKPRAPLLIVTILGLATLFAWFGVYVLAMGRYSP